MVDLERAKALLKGFQDAEIESAQEDACAYSFMCDYAEPLLDEVKRLRLLRDGYQGEGRIPYV